MPALANLPVEIWERIIYDVVGPANPIPNSEFPWVSGIRSDACFRAALKQRLQKLQSLSAVARTWRELCLTLSYETLHLISCNPTRWRWLLNTQLPRFPSIFHRTRRLVVIFVYEELKHTRETIPHLVKLVGEMPVLQDLDLSISTLQSESERRRLVEKGIMEALRLIGSKLQFLQIKEGMNQYLKYECILTGQSVEVLSALAPNLTRLICAVEVDKSSSSDPVFSFPNLQILHMRLHADRFEQASVHNWIRRWRLGALKQFGARGGGSIPISEWVPILLSGNNGRTLEVFEVGIGLKLPSGIPPFLWAQCPNLHTIMGTELQRIHLNLPPTHRPLKALVYKETLIRYDSPESHFVRALRDIDFAANTTITFSELTWEEVLGSGVSHSITYQASGVVDAGINAGLRLVDANGEVVDEFLARTGRGYPLLSLA